jgi:hypothetical protein
MSLRRGAVAQRPGATTPGEAFASRPAQEVGRASRRKPIQPGADAAARRNARPVGNEKVTVA